MVVVVVVALESIVILELMVGVVMIIVVVVVVVVVVAVALVHGSSRVGSSIVGSSIVGSSRVGSSRVGSSRVGSSRVGSSSRRVGIVVALTVLTLHLTPHSLCKRQFQYRNMSIRMNYIRLSISAIRGTRDKACQYSSL